VHTYDSWSYTDCGEYLFPRHTDLLLTQILHCLRST
jgi:hypothetical protein